MYYAWWGVAVTKYTFYRGAIIESIISNARYAVRDGDRSEGGATIESIIINTIHRVRDNQIFYFYIIDIEVVRIV